jgi:predicted nucleotidyltransferase
MTNRFNIAQNFALEVKSEKINKIILFGSVARGEDNEDSDIDILIVSSFEDDLFDTVYGKIYEVLINEKELISAHFVTNERFTSDKESYFLSSVLEEGVVIG